MSGNKENIGEFLRSLELDDDTRYRELSSEDTRKLNSALMLRMVDDNIKFRSISNYLRTKYWIPEKRMFVSDITGLVNACGRMGEESTGLGVCFWHEESLARARELRKTYLKRIRDGLQKIENDGVFLKDNLQFFYCDYIGFAGIHAGLGMEYLLDQGRPTIGLTVKDKNTKVSTRGTQWLIGKGLNLAEACRMAADDIGGYGGGHPIAAGATIPKGKEDAFLEKMDDIIGNQMS